MTVYCYDLVAPKSDFWDSRRDQYLRDNYNEKIHVDPKLLAIGLGTHERAVLNRLARLNLRPRNSKQETQRPASAYLPPRRTR